jgi:TolA-binding protein
MSAEATQTISVYDVLGWLETNKTPVIAACVAAVVIGFGIAAYEWKSSQTEVQASDALLQLKTTFGRSEETNPVPASAYLSVASQYPGTTAGERALLLGAGQLFSEGKYPEAQSEFSKFLRDRPQSPFAATAAYGVAASLEAQGKQDEALAAYQNLSVRFPNSSILPDSKLAVGRIYVAKNQPESALRVYDELIKSPDLSGAGTAASEAATARQQLLAKYPDLVKTNAAPAISVQPANPAKSVGSVAPKASTAPANKP